MVYGLKRADLFIQFDSLSCDFVYCVVPKKNIFDQKPSSVVKQKALDMFTSKCFLKWYQAIYKAFELYDANCQLYFQRLVRGRLVWKKRLPSHFLLQRPPKVLKSQIDIQFMVWHCVARSLERHCGPASNTFSENLYLKLRSKSKQANSRQQPPNDT